MPWNEPPPGWGAPQAPSGDYGSALKQYGFSSGNPTGDMLNHLAVQGEYPLMKSQLDFANQLEPGREANVNHFIALLQHPDSLAELHRRGVMDDANHLATQTAQQLRATGEGIGAEQGAQTSALNQGAHAANQFTANLYSPQGLQQTASALMQLYQANDPRLQDAIAMAQALRPAPSAPDNTLGQLGSLAAGIGALGL